MKNYKDNMKKKSESSQPKYFIFFVTAYITFSLTQEILLNRFVSIKIGSAYITGGALVCLSSLLIIDIVTEVYGYKLARKMAWCGFFAPIVMAGLITLCLHMPYPIFWKETIIAYQQALSSILKIALVSSPCLLAGQLINAYLISKWKILMRGKYFWLRSIGSSVIGDSISVILSLMLIYAGRAPFHLIWINAFTNISIGFIFTTIAATPSAYIAKLTTKVEGLSIYDTTIDFNPFKLTS